MGYAVEDESAKHNAEGRRAGRNGGPPTFFPVAPQAFLRQELELLEERSESQQKAKAIKEQTLHTHQTTLSYQVPGSAVARGIRYRTLRYLVGPQESLNAHEAL